MFDQIIDANVNRIGEGLRVIEEYVRFVVADDILAKKIAQFRQDIHSIFPQEPQHLLIRDIEKDARAKHKARERRDVKDVLTANFKRVQEALRVLEEYCAEARCSNMRYDMYQLEKDILLGLLKPQIRPGFYLVSANPEHIKAAFNEESVSLIQYRDKHISKQAYFEKAKELKAFSNAFNTPFIINDFIDIAIRLDADGFHSGQDDISVCEQRQLLGPHKLIGRTTHTAEQGKIAESQGADYVSVGPIWETPSKPGRPAIGFDYLKEAQAQLTVPYVAIGGINSRNIQDVLIQRPPLIGIVRAFEELPTLSALLKEHSK